MAHLIRIGNSFGVRIPKAIIHQAGFEKEMNLIFKITEDGLLISSEKHAREGWEQQFKSPKKGRKNPSLLGELSNDFDKEEWEW